MFTPEAISPPPPSGGSVTADRSGDPTVTRRAPSPTASTPPTDGSAAPRGSADSGPAFGAPPGGVAQGQGPCDQQSRIQAEPLRPANQVPDSGALTPRDLALIAALDDPDAKVDYRDYTPWLKRPEIQEALAAREFVLTQKELARERRTRERNDQDARAGAALLHEAAQLARELEGRDRVAELRRIGTQLVRRATRATDLAAYRLSTPSRLCTRREVGAEPPATSLRARAGAALSPSPPLGGSVTADRASGQAMPLGVRRGETRGAPSSTASTPPRSPKTHDSGPGTQGHDPSWPPGQSSSLPQHSAPSSQTRRGETQHSTPDPDPDAEPHFPGLPEKAYDFLLAVDSPHGLSAILRHCAVHWIEELGGDQNTLAFLSGHPHLMNYTRAELGEPTYAPEEDTAVVPVWFTQPDGSIIDGTLFAVVETAEDAHPYWWAIAGLTPKPPPPTDTS